FAEFEVVPRQSAKGAERPEIREISVVEALDPTTLLVDEDRRIRPAKRLADLRAEPDDLIAGVDVAPEQEQPVGVRVAQQRHLVGGEFVSLDTNEQGERGIGHCSLPPDLTRSRP